MKRLLIVLVVLFLSFPAFAEFHGFLEIGKALENEWAKAEVELQYHFNFWRLHNEIYGGWETWFIPHDLKGSPFQDIYSMGYRLGYKAYYLEIEHHCNHPVYSKYNQDWWLQNRLLQGDLTTISIGVKW